MARQPAANSSKKRTGGNPAAGSYLLYLVLVIILVAAAAMLLPVYRNLQKKQRELSELHEQLLARKVESARYNAEVNALNTPEGVEKTAREKYKLVREGETVLTYPTPKRENSGVR